MFDLLSWSIVRIMRWSVTGWDARGHWSTVLGLARLDRGGRRHDRGAQHTLAELTGAHVHCQHLSYGGERRVAAGGPQTRRPDLWSGWPTYFTLTGADISGSDSFWAEDGVAYLVTRKRRDAAAGMAIYDTNFKMNPQLRCVTRRQALLRAKGRND